MVANKMTGKKGILFTAAYVERFHEYEDKLKEQMPSPMSPAQLLAAQAQVLVDFEKKLEGTHIRIDQIGSWVAQTNDKLDLVEKYAKDSIAETRKKAELAEFKTVNALNAKYPEHSADRLREVVEGISKRTGFSKPTILRRLYKELEQTEHCDLSIRLKRRRERIAKQGAIAKAVAAVCILDVIADDPKLFPAK